MKRLPQLIISLLVILLLVGSNFATKVQAGNLTNTQVRLDRTAANTTTGGQICATTPSIDNGTESSIKVTFPNSFTVNSSAANWTTNTTNLRSGAVAWPGVATATQISGKTVTFLSSDLSASTTYCFNFSASNTLTTGAIGNDQYGTVATITSGGATIDSREFAISIVPNDQINIRATVGAKPTDYSAQLDIQDGSPKFGQNTTITYMLTYGSNLQSTSDITLEAEWSLGTVGDSGVPTADILNYVTGSASHAYNNVEPVIDLVNRKISWTIPAFPANTGNKTVTFQLATNDTFTGTAPVSFDVTGRLLALSTATPDSTITRTYLYNYQPPVPTGVPATPTITQVVTVTPKPAPVKAQTININTILSTSATISVHTETSAGAIVRYGDLQNALNQSVSDPGFAQDHVLILRNLKPKTRYYFQVKTIDENGKNISSDIYTFVTASPSIAPELDLATLVMISGNNILVNGSNTDHPLLIIPTNSDYKFDFSLQGRQIVDRIKATLENKKTLGISTIGNNAGSEVNNVEIQEIQPGVYTGRLLGQPKPGLYELYLTIFDKNGNVVQQKLADVKVVSPFIVYSNANKEGLDGAKVTLSRYDDKLRIWLQVAPHTIVEDNPTYSTHDGSVNYVLPQGKYRVNIKAIGYRDYNGEFTIDDSEKSDYPQIYMTYVGFNFFNQMEYYMSAAIDFWDETSSYVRDISRSIRFFELNAFIATTILIFLTLLALSNRIHIPLHSFFDYILHIGKVRVVQKKLGSRIKGRVFDQNSAKGLSGVDVFLIDIKKRKIVGHTKTNESGDFTFLKSTDTHYQLEVMSDSYEPVIFNESELAAVGLGGYMLDIHKHALGPNAREKVMIYIDKVIALSFESLLVLSFIFEISMGAVLGFAKAAPFLLFSILSLVIWIIHLSHERGEKNVF
ncbi:MAG TPA: hypothetical protein VG965_03545 [Patescibacteria group bacterium]|nr:hypothetical protein [Patescibacteria group bacterium]